MSEHYDQREALIKAAERALDRKYKRGEPIQPKRLAGENAPKDSLREALEKIAGSHWERTGYDQTDVDDVPDLSAEDAMKLARAALTVSLPREREIAVTDDAPPLTPFQFEILKRGEDGREIWVRDRAELFGMDMAVLRELKRAGLVEYSTKPTPPGPPAMPSFVLTEAGLAALQQRGGE